MIPTLLRFADLKERGIVTTWPTLLKWVEKQGFPPGRKLGPNTRVWSEEEINDWLDSRPNHKQPLRGIARRKVAGEVA